MHDPCLWVLMAEGDNVRIFSSEHGMMEFTPSEEPAIDPDTDEAPASPANARQAGMDSAAGTTRLMKHLAQFLSAGAVRGCYDGLILVGSPRFLGGLRRALPPATRPLVVGEIARAPAPLKGTGWHTDMRPHVVH